MPALCYYLTSFISREHPKLDTLHMRAYRGWLEVTPDESEVYALNIRTGPLWLPIASMVTMPELGERLKNVSTLRTRPARVQLAFDWDMRNLTPLARYAKSFHGHTAKAGDQAVEHFMRSQGRVSESFDVVEIQPVSAERLRERYEDTREIEVSAPDIVPKTVLLSRCMVEDHGVVRSSGFLFAPRAFDIIRPYVEDSPWFLVKQL